MSWVDLGKLRIDIAEIAEERARSAGVENPRVSVRIDEPDARGRRAITVQVSAADTSDVERELGRRWQDNLCRWRIRR